MAKILVIDDDAGLRQMVKVMLEREGHQVAVAENGQSGLNAILSDPPDAAVVDLMMPGMSGYDVTRQIRANPTTARLPILILTARNQPMDQQIALKIGATAFMSKPVVSKDLAERLTTILTAPPEPPASAAAPVADAAKLVQTGTLSGMNRIPQTGSLRRIVSDPATVKRPLTPIIAIMAAERSSGSTTLAINLTFTLRQLYERVCLIDLRPFGGEVQAALRLNGAHTWADLLPLGDKIDTRSVSSVLTPHPQQGIGVIGSPATPPPMLPTASMLSALFTVLGSGFPQIVVDLGEWNDASAAVLRMARSVVVVASTNSSSPNAASGLASRLRSLSITPDRTRLVVSSTRPNALVSADTLSEATGLPVSVELPFDPLQSQSLQRGVPLIVLAPNSAYTQAMSQWTRTLVST